MITRTRRRRYVVLAVLLAVLTGTCSFWVNLEPAAAEDSQDVTLLDDSLLEEGFGEDDIQVLEAEASVNYSTCSASGEVGLGDPEEIASEQIFAAIQNVTVLQQNADQNIKKMTAQTFEPGFKEREVEVIENEEEETSYEGPSYYYEDYGSSSDEDSIDSSSDSGSSGDDQAPASSDSGNDSSQNESNSTPSVTYSDLDYLAAICQIEAGSSYEGALAVANVILNRLHNGYADSIYGVIYAPYQFATGSMDYYLQNGTSDIVRQAAQDALNGVNNVGSYCHFNGTAWLDPASLDCSYVVIGGNCFY